ncbi:uncharacterized protein LOC135486950 [Lineus longissimus]|uniref:uncharacterized protein LOC135486950 n=1 Tax=Lineus longissimus TaxID=88925 RepID=UPI002B4D7134
MVVHRYLAILLILTSACTGEKEEREIEGHNPDPDFLPFLKPESVAALGALPFERLPKNIQRMIREVGDSSHWCCALPTSKFVTHSAAELNYRVTSHNEAYYRGCGWWGWSKCKVYKTVYKHSTSYGASYRLVEVPVECPAHKVVCCKTYIMVAEHCLPISELEKVKGDLLKLHELGEI